MVASSSDSSSSSNCVEVREGNDNDRADPEEDLQTPFLNQI
jgi:hypothetical protein